MALPSPSPSPTESEPASGMSCTAAEPCTVTFSQPDTTMLGALLLVLIVIAAARLFLAMRP